MTEVIGSVRLSVNPETSGFGAKVRAALGAALRGVDTKLPAFEADFTKVNAEARNVSRKVENAFEKASRGSDGALRDIGGAATFIPVRASAASASNGVSRSFKEASRESDRALSKIGDSSPFSSLIKQAFAFAIAITSVNAAIGVSKIFVLGPALVGVAVAAIALVGALGPLVGLLGALPGLALAGGAAFGVVALATRGVGAALKAYGEQQKEAAAASKATAEAVKTASIAYEAAQERVKDATEGVSDSERRLQTAQLNAKDAQLGLTQARKAAQEQLEDMRLELAGTVLGEERARLTLKKSLETEKELQLRRRRGGRVTADEVADANLTVRESQLGVERSLDARGDAEEKSAELMAKGVEGSDLVVAANERVAKSQEELSDATRGVEKANRELTLAINGMADAAEKLGKAAEGPVNKFNEAMKELSPAAQALVRTLISFKEPLKALGDVAAQGLFPGVQAGLEALRPLFEKLTPVIFATARVMGDFVRKLGELIGGKAFSSDLVTIGSANTKVIKTLGDAFLTILPAITDIAVAAIPLVQGLADMAKEWANSAAGAARFGRESGGLANFFAKTLDVVRKVFRIIGNVFSILKNIFGAASDGIPILDILTRITDRMADFISKARESGALKNFFATIGTIFGAVFGKVKLLFDILSKEDGVFDAIGRVVQELAPLFERLGPVVGVLADALGRVLIAVLPILTPLLTLAVILLERIGVPLIKGVADVLVVMAEAVEKLAKFLAGENGLNPALDKAGVFLREHFGPPLHNIGIILKELVLPVLKGLLPILEFIAKISFDQFVATLSVASSVLTTYTNFIVERVIPDLKKMVGFINEEVVPKFKDFAGVVKTEVLPKLRDMTSAIQDGVIRVLNGIKGAIDTEVVPALQSLRGYIETDLIPIFERFTTTLRDDTKPALESLKNFINDDVIPAFNRLKDKIQEDLQPALDRLQAFYYEHIKPFLTELAGLLSDVLTPAVDFLATVLNTVLGVALSQAQGALDRLGFVVGVVARVTGEWYENQLKPLAGLLLDILGVALDDTTNKIKLLRDFVNEVKDAMGRLRDFIRDDLVPTLRDIPGVGAIGFLLDKIPKKLAHGGIVDSPTFSLIGEAGKEVVLPLTNAKRTLELAQQSGLFEVLAKAQGATASTSAAPPSFSSSSAAAPAAGGGGTSVVIENLTVTVGGDGKGDPYQTGVEVGNGVRDALAGRRINVLARAGA